jgi:membrane associated rhomboid family serine protease
MAPMADDVVERPKVAELFTPLVPVLAMLAVMWSEEVVDTALDGRLDRFGIRPRQLGGLDGIVFSPFLHSGFGHLVANTLPFLFLGGAICLGSARRFVQVTVIVGAISGAGTWLTGPVRSLHIGASGLVFGYLTYLITRGAFARKASYIFGGLVAFLVYGGVLWGLVPRPGVSWQGHLFGAIGGVVAAWILHHQPGADRAD